MGIAGTKITATHKCLHVLNDIEIPEDSNSQHCASVDCLHAQLLTLHQTLIQCRPTLTHQQWEEISCCCCAIAGISLEGVCCCFLWILSELALVADMGYLDWV